jgi:hypothetical protein
VSSSLVSSVYTDLLCTERKVSVIFAYDIIFFNVIHAEAGIRLLDFMYQRVFPQKQWLKTMEFQFFDYYFAFSECFI